ncbi:glycosyltransferase family 4 protein [Enterococcus faecium]|uniref:glycosyltransferase family 4 protein n=1 Tax=Enterococcus faecium TaxID=1352 RepID=UPI000DE93942|nr:glycosyltransferase family 4 protein [Enterococcus faecium]MDK4463596.1 glycosyltransferase family 4 protein [Enterococcus faecium]MDT2328708.1 glycosyltransferase family 4 protein [Enterococcus faecium]NTQ03028.1 glycosyltransferase family 4 protein [Enterococcus faecium]NTQ13933.1 glycosyltransferase family 4 protein [Enterococcus faecium]NTR76972.1 glycosyltransferase family 4 protein [Enterococcus faecium]
MKILYVTTISNTINAFLIPHIKLLQSEGHEVDVACNIIQPLSKDLQNISECKIFDIPFNRNPIKKENLKAYKALKGVINKNSYDIVHTHTPIASSIVRLVCRKEVQTKVFYTAHGFHFYKGAPLINWLFYFPMEYWLSKYTNQLITINQEDYIRAKKLFRAKKVRFVHGVGLVIKKEENIENDKQEKKRELNISKDQIVLLSVGELNKNKNHKFIIECLKNFKDVNFKYLICGEGVLKESLQETIHQYKLDDKVELLGYRTDIAELLNISDYFIFPSKREGLPVSIMESMACGVPVICSKIRGNSDLIKDNINGFLFSLENKKEITQILNEVLLGKYGEDKLNCIKENAVKAIQNYSLQNVLNELNEVYTVK